MEKYFITKKQSNALYRSLKFFHDMCVKHKITYFIAFGTLLGAVRHQGVIPHDDDGDLCVLEKDLPKLRKLIPKFQKKGYILEEYKTWYFAMDNDHGLGIDIFVVKPNKKGDKFVYADPYWQTAESGGGKTCYFDTNQLFPLLPARFGNFFLYVPHNPIHHLNRCYGDDWNHKSTVLYNHRDGVWVNSKMHSMGKDEFLTIKPPSDTCDKKVPEVKCYDKRRDYVF